jgi:hypothetical protein
VNKKDWEGNGYRIIKLLSHYFLIGTEENYEKPQSGFVPSSSQIRVWSFIAGIICSVYAISPQSALECFVQFLQQTDITSLNSKHKGKDTPMLHYEQGDDIWGVEVYLHTFKTSEPDEGERSAS